MVDCPEYYCKKVSKNEDITNGTRKNIKNFKDLLDLMADIVFPDDYELISFFEMEPELLDFDIPWFYNIITFQRQYADELLYCTFSPSYGDMDLTLIRNQKTKVVLSLHNITTTRILKDSNSEHLKLSFSGDSLSEDFLLTLKPEVSIIWRTKSE